MAFKEGVLVFAQPGALPQSALQDVIEQVKDLDMAPIKEQMAAEATAGAPDRRPEPHASPDRAAGSRLAATPRTRRRASRGGTPFCICRQV